MRYLCISIFTTIFSSILANYFQDFKTIARSCDYSCRQGACLFRECNNPSCSGGGCHFIACINPTCDGGVCLFENSKNATCKGGGCNFVNPSDVLEDGYCNGEGCLLNGHPHPNFKDYVAF